MSYHTINYGQLNAFNISSNPTKTQRSALLYFMIIHYSTTYKAEGQVSIMHSISIIQPYEIDPFRIWNSECPNMILYFRKWCFQI